MKLQLVLATLCVLLGVSSAGPFHLHAPKGSGRALMDDLSQFIALVPQDEVLAIFLEYLANDPEVGETVGFMSSPRYAELIDSESSIPEFFEYMQFLEDSGLPAYDFWNQYRESLGLDPLPRPSAHKAGSSRGMLELQSAILAILDPQPFQELFQKLLVESAEFKTLVDRLFSAEYSEVVNKFLSSPTMQSILEELKDNGLDIIALDNQMRDHFFGTK